MKDGIFKQLRKLKEPPLWHSSGVPVGTPWVGQQPLKLVAAGSINRPSFKFVLKIKASGGAHKKQANPDRLNFHVAQHIKAALGDLLLSLDVFNSQQHLSSVPVVVMDHKTRQVFLSFPCATQPKFRYELPSSAASNNGKEPAQSNSPVLRNTCGKKRKAARLAGADDALPPLSLHEDVPDMMQDDFDADAAFAEMNLEPPYHCAYMAWEAWDAMQEPPMGGLGRDADAIAFRSRASAWRLRIWRYQHHGYCKCWGCLGRFLLCRRPVGNGSQSWSST